MKIMIVDDEENISKGILAIIESNVDFSTSIQLAADGQQAYNIATAYKPDLVITDVRMHMMNGLDLVKILKENSLCKNFIIISGYDNFTYAQTAIRFGVKGYLLKPIDKCELLTLINAVYNSLPQYYASTKCPELPELEYFSVDLEGDNYPTSLKKAIAYMKKNYMNDISLQTLSDELLLHPCYISSLFGKYTGNSFKSLLGYIRIKKAAELLLSEEDLTMSEISYLVGYNNERRLYDAFQKRLNCTPRDFRGMYGTRL